MQQLAEAWHLLGNLAHKSYWSIDGTLSQGEEQLVSLFLSGGHRPPGTLPAPGSTQGPSQEAGTLVFPKCCLG